MSRNRSVSLLIGLATAVVLLLGWFLGVSPILSQVTAANLQTRNLQTANAASSAKLEALKKQYANIGPLKAQLSDLEKSIPTDASIADFLAEINALCASTGVSLTSLTVNDALAYVAEGAGASTGTGSGAPSPAPPTASPTPPPGDKTQSAPADSSTGLIAIPVRIVVLGEYSQVMAFSGALQTGARLMLVSTLRATASTTDSRFSGELLGNIYALPLPAGVAPVTTSTATPTPSPSPTATGSATPDAPTPTPTP